MGRVTPALGEFLADEKDLLNCLADRPKCAPITTCGLLPMEDLEVRLQAIDEIRKRLAPEPGEEEPQMNYLQFAALMLLPLSFLLISKEMFHGTVQHDISTEKIQATLFFSKPRSRLVLCFIAN